MEETTTPISDDRFERIGTTYYKIVRQPNAAGQLIEGSIPWTIEAIRQDYGKDFLANVPKYDGHCCVPSHLDYRPVIGSFKNKYSPLSHIPSAGTWPSIESLVRHIMGVFLNEPAYVESRKVGRYYTVTRQMLENL